MVRSRAHRFSKRKRKQPLRPGVQAHCYARSLKVRTPLNIVICFQGYTALHLAVIHNHENIIISLLDCGTFYFSSHEIVVV